MSSLRTVANPMENGRFCGAGSFVIGVSLPVISSSGAQHTPAPKRKKNEAGESKAAL